MLRTMVGRAVLVIALCSGASQPLRQRLVSMRRAGRDIEPSDTFEVAVSGIIAKGGDHFDTFTRTRFLREYEPLGELTIAYFRKYGAVAMPRRGRQTDLAVNAP